MRKGVALFAGAVLVQGAIVGCSSHRVQTESTGTPQAGLAVAGAAAAPGGAIDFDQHVSPLLNSYCTSCHSGPNGPADVALDFTSEEAAREKAAACPEAGFVLAADTVVALGQRNLEKAADAEEAETFLRLLSGRAHQCITGIAVKAPDGGVNSRTVMARVKMKRLTDQEIAAYIASEEWRGKAGGYGIQGMAGAFITHISGSYTTIVGLPLYETKSLLEGLGWRAS